jgi:nitrogen PTS system EIIA component
MNHEIMTIEEVADYLRVSERTVYDWAQKGQLPGGKLGTTWRFKRSDIENWVNRRLGASAVAKPAAESGLLEKILSADRVLFLEQEDKPGALKTLCAALAATPQVHNGKELEEAIFRREELMSTGIGFGVGVPHVRLASVEDLVLALGIARQPIADYASLDKVPVQIICMVAAGSSQHPQYIRALSAISSRLKEEGLREALITAPHAAAAYQLFTGTEA